MNIEEIKAKVAKASEEAREKKNIQEQQCYARVNNLYQQARQLLPEVGELCELINYALSEGYLIQTHSTFISRLSNSDAPRLQTDGIEHDLGFYGNRVVGLSINQNVRFQYVGIENGGCNGEIDLKANNCDIYWGRKSFADYCHGERYWEYAEINLRRFIASFPKFKDAVLNFMENISTYKCYL